MMSSVTFLSCHLFVKEAKVMRLARMPGLRAFCNFPLHACKALEIKKQIGPEHEVKQIFQPPWKIAKVNPQLK